MFGLSNLELQFGDESSIHDETVLSTSEERNNLEILPSKPASSADPNLTAPSPDRSNILPSSPSILAERSHAPSTSTPSADRSNTLPLTASLDDYTNQSAGPMPSAYAGSTLKGPLQSTSAETSLTSTWKLCKSLYNVDNSEQTCSNTTLTEMNFPVPSPVVLEFLELITNKEVQNFCLKLSQHYKFKKQEEVITESSTDKEFPLDVMESLDCAPTYSELMPQKNQSLGLRRSPRKHVSSSASFTGNSTCQPYYQTSEECTSTCTQKPTEKFSATKDLNQYQEAPIQQIQMSPFPCPSPLNSQHQSPNIQSSTFSSQHFPSPLNSQHQPPNIQSSTFSSQHFPSPLNSHHQPPNIQSLTFSSQQSPSPLNSQHQPPNIQSSTFSSHQSPSYLNSQHQPPNIQGSTFSSHQSPSPLNSQHQPPNIQSSTFSSHQSPSPLNSQHQPPNIQSSTFSSHQSPSPLNSPSQHVMQSHDSDQSDDNKMVKLLQTSDVQVRRGSLRKANTNASKGATQKSSFKLASSLLPLLFSVDELANSCGQGLKKKANDVRTPLDPVRIGVLKDYVTAWCAKHNRCMQDCQINDAVTEQVSYARKKIKKL
ncbi:uncharacterized protein [Mytilus edulis]|uniref:uncharacterized protein n=1 Tax=Mytilus edulis TaxID=6550 RepID=UPI0039EE31A8